MTKVWTLKMVKTRRAAMLQELLDLKGEMFGEIRPGSLPCEGNHKPDFVQLRTPFRKSWWVMYIFCTGCGVQFGVNREIVDAFLRISGTDLPENLANHFIEVCSCPFCVNGNVFSAGMRAIPPAK